MSGDRRVKLAKTLTESRDFIIKKAANELFQGRPNLVSPGGNAFGKEMTATCLRDMDYYLRLITYSVVTGDTTPIQENRNHWCPTNVWLFRHAPRWHG